ncbi:histidine ammonia-lyase [Vulcanibacillus modesticaldus]|uniref:Histidine ammonia-lyase n=1 Tax=Vulcanibacillus modesticaldus TaxID=337097 RepID=A0A1D2YTQ8_9BACI|nr:histidine ammonia-lyase [Vulcanibacillus modesticaldus]OEF99041.1 histidine ammonia-lyase [Vulcanibacillus modesticaldus]
MTVILNGNSLTIDQIEQVVLGKEMVQISESAWEKVSKSRKLIEDSIREGKIIYGVNTGFGKLSDVSIDNGALEQLQYYLIRSHASAVGAPFSEEISRAMILLRANALAKGYSGVRKETLEQLINLLNHQIYPIIPEQGSLGASGDLAPLSHLALVLIGEGEAIVDGERLSGKEALAKRGLKPIRLSAKEGLALINGTQAMTAVAVLTYLEAIKTIDQANRFAGLTMEGLRGVIDAFDEQIHETRPYQGQIEVAKKFREQLKGSQLITKQGEIRVQDAYTIRCIPQVHGAIQQVLDYVRGVLEIEINAATDNPLIFPETGDILSGGNFHGQPVAFAMDFLGIAMSELANMSERRIERLVNSSLSGLPAFLSPNPGLQSGMMIAQYVAASLVSENKVLAHPASVDSIPSSANQEDHVSMGTIAARHANQIVQNSRRVVAIEGLCAALAVEKVGVDKLSSESSKLYKWIREEVSTLDEDRVISTDIEKLSIKMKKEKL